VAVKPIRIVAELEHDVFFDLCHKLWLSKSHNAA
jgi:hypothetical protein